MPHGTFTNEVDLDAMTDEAFDDDPGDPTAVEPQGPTIMEEVQNMAGTLMKISKATKMSETGVLSVFSFIWQQNEQAKQRNMAPQPTGQDMVDAIAREHAANEENQTREADEEL